MSARCAFNVPPSKQPMTITIESEEGPLTMELRIKLKPGWHLPPVAAGEQFEAMFATLMPLVKPMPEVKS